MAHIPMNPRDPRFNPNAIVDRRSFESQLWDAQGRPTRVMYEFCGRMQMEVGSQGREAQMAFAESVFNRCAARNHTLDYELRNHSGYSYWPQRQSSPGYSRNQALIDIITMVCRQGTNISRGATGNDGVGDGINTSAPTTYQAGGERFSIEHADRNWHANRFVSLIRGIGRFIGDIVGALGTAVSTVVHAAADGVRSFFENLFGVRRPHTQPDAPPHQVVPPRTYPGLHQHQQPHPALRPRRDEIPLANWSVNVRQAPVTTRQQTPDPHPENGPRPS